MASKFNILKKILLLMAITTVFFLPACCNTATNLSQPVFKEPPENALIPTSWTLKGFGKGGKTKCNSPETTCLFLEPNAPIGHSKWVGSIKGVERNKNYVLSFYSKQSNISDYVPYVFLFGKQRYVPLKQDKDWQQFNLLFQSKNNKEITSVTFGQYRRPYKLWIGPVWLKELEFMQLIPGMNDYVGPGLPEFIWHISDIDDVLEVVIECSNKPTMVNSVSWKTNSLKSTFTPPSFPLTGEIFWRLSLYKNNVLLQRTEIMSFLKKDTPAMPEKPEWKYKHFFPIGLFSVPDIEDFEEIKNAGFNVVHLYIATPSYLNVYINEAAKIGLKVMPYPGLRTPKMGLEKISRVNSLFETQFSHNTILAWYLADEPNYNTASSKDLAIVKDKVLGFDPINKSAITINTVSKFRTDLMEDYAPVADIVLVDPYPVKAKRSTLIRVSETIEKAKEILALDKPIWVILQAFGYINDELTGWGWQEPTYKQLRCMSFLALSKGAKGVFFFTYKGSVYDMRKSATMWQSVQKTAKFLNIIGPMIGASHSMTDDNELKEFISAEKGLVFGAWNINDPTERVRKLLLLVTQPDDKQGILSTKKQIILKPVIEEGVIRENNELLIKPLGIGAYLFEIENKS